MATPPRRTAPPAPQQRTTSYNREEYVKRTQEQVKKRQSEQKSKSRYIITDLERAEPAAGEVSIWSVIPYIVKERHHPEEIPAGKLAWKRPFVIHRNMGIEEIVCVCPKSFNSRDRCVVHEDVAMLRKDWDKNEEHIRRVQGSERELYLFYDHKTKKAIYYDAAYGSVKNPGFGFMLGSRLDNPVKEDWNGFWLPDDEGYALRITWGESSFGGGGVWVRPISIDFVPRKEQPVPSWVWGKAVELSELLVKTSSKDLEDLYYSGGYTETSDSSEEQQQEDAPDDTKEEDPEEGDDIPFDSMSKAELLAFARENALFEPVDLRALNRTPEESIRQVIAEAWQGRQEPEQDGEAECPLGHPLGKFLNKFNECTSDDCPEEVYAACVEAASK